MVELARFTFGAILLGLGEHWGSHELDTADERYRRCLIASGAALDDLWDARAIATPGVPLEASEELIFEAYLAVESFTFALIQKCYEYHSVVTKPMWRTQCRLSEAAARRAVVSLFGRGTMAPAQARMDRLIAQGIRFD